MRSITLAFVAPTVLAALLSCDPPLDPIGPSIACQDDIPVPPLDGEFFTATEHPIREDGAVALRRFVPHVYPYTATGFVYRMSRNHDKRCAPVDFEIVWFIGPAEAPQGAPVAWQESGVEAAHLPWGDGDTATATFTIGEDGITLAAEGVALYVGIRTHVVNAGRACPVACAGPHNPSDVWLSRTNANGVVAPCPGAECEWATLGSTPTPAIAPQLFRSAFDWQFTLHGSP